MFLNPSTQPDPWTQLHKKSREDRDKRHWETSFKVQVVRFPSDDDDDDEDTQLNSEDVEKIFCQYYLLHFWDNLERGLIPRADKYGNFEHAMRLHMKHFPTQMGQLIVFNHFQQACVEFGYDIVTDILYTYVKKAIQTNSDLALNDFVVEAASAEQGSLDAIYALIRMDPTAALSKPIRKKDRGREPYAQLLSIDSDEEESIDSNDSEEEEEDIEPDASTEPIAPKKKEQAFYIRPWILFGEYRKVGSFAYIHRCIYAFQAIFMEAFMLLPFFAFGLLEILGVVFSAYVMRMWVRCHYRCWMTGESLADVMIFGLNLIPVDNKKERLVGRLLYRRRFISVFKLVFMDLSLLLPFYAFGLHEIMGVVFSAYSMMVLVHHHWVRGDSLVDAMIIGLRLIPV